MTEENNALIQLEAIKPQEVFVAGGTDSLIAVVEAEVAKFSADAATEEGRKAIWNFKNRIAATQTGIDTIKKEHTENLRKTVNAINAEAKRFSDRMDELKEDVMAPRRAWEQKEAARVQGHKDRIDTITALLPAQDGYTSADIANRLATARDLQAENYDWEDFAELAQQTFDQVLERLSVLQADTQRREEETAELERLRAEKAERDRRDEEDRLRREGELAAGLKAEQERIDADNRRKAGHQSRINQISALVNNLNTAASAVIIERRQQADDLMRSGYNWEEFTQQAQQVYDSVVETLDTVLPAAQLREQQAEADRIAAAKKAEADAEKARQADKDHRARINREALDAMVSSIQADAMDEQDKRLISKDILTAIAKGQIPHVKISY